MGGQGHEASPTCSFCGKPQGEQVHLLAANGRHICNYCVAFAYRAFEAEGHLPREPEEPMADDLEQDTVTRLKPPGLR